jgi:hypothetical protein
VSVEILSAAWRTRPITEFVRASLESTRACFQRAEKAVGNG